MANKKTNSWVAFDPNQTGAENPFFIREGEDGQRKVILNQFGQLLDADTRHLIEPDTPPKEMMVIKEEKPEGTAAES